jgi:ABC-type nitrate/sulfonate/bicarbonate transport system ATPase subunit
VQLSLGMRQRVALARTFAMRSPILLMDEPFGTLDTKTKLQLEDVLLGLWHEEQRTVLFVTHDLAEAIVLSDRVVVMSARPAPDGGHRHRPAATGACAPEGSSLSRNLFRALGQAGRGAGPRRPVMNGFRRAA